MFQVHLLGVPSVSDSAGVTRTPRGRKTWAMVAYLMISELPPPRKRLAELFHSEADDPLGALRWTLADARRLLSPDISIDGDPVMIQINSSAMIDVSTLASAAVGDLLPSATLLDGLEFRDAPYLQGWLDLERHRIQSEVCSFIMEAARAALTADEPGEAVRLSERLVDIDPFEERHHAMLVRALIGAGNSAEADLRAAAGSSLLTTTLGVEQTTLIDTAKAVGIKEDLTSSHSIRALIEAGRAAMGAGVPDGALRTLGSALRDARVSGDSQVLCDALVAMGEALIHSIRGLDEIGQELLVEAEAIAATTGNTAALVMARGELGYVANLRGDYTAADRWFQRALDAGPELDDTAMIYSRLGIGLSDRARHEEAIEMAISAVATATESENSQALAHTQAMLGRAHFMAGSPAAAISPLRKSLQITKASGWISFRPLPEALLAQALTAIGAYEEAKKLAQASFALACEIGDPCWEGLGAQALAMAALMEGNAEEARARLEDGFSRATRVSDGWSWLNGQILADLCNVLIDLEPTEARARLTELEAIAQLSSITYLIDRGAALRTRLDSA